MSEATDTHPLLGAEFEAETDRLTGTSVRAGNAVVLMASGSRSYERRWQLIEGARHSIDLATFSVMNDATSRRLLELLREKIRAGVAVRMVADDAAILSSSSGDILSELSKAGAEVIRYHKLFRDWLPDLRRGHPFKQLVRNLRYKMKRRYHEKFTVVDGRECVLGGINWGDKYAQGGLKPEAWRDTDVSLSGPVVADIRRQFNRSFFLYRAMEEEYEARRRAGFDREAHYEAAKRRAEEFEREKTETHFPPLAPAGAERVRYVPHKPYDEERLPLTEALLLMLRRAGRYVYWGCHAVRPPRVIAETLAEAVARGVEVRLITNSRKSSQALMARGFLGLMYMECANHFRWLVERGVRVHEWQLPGAFHSKNLVIDDAVASVGSYNVASGSAFHHTESNVVVYGGDFPAQVRRQFEVDLQDCREVTLAETHAPRPLLDPFRRPLHPRNLLIDRSLLTEAVRRDLDAGLIKQT